MNFAGTDFMSMELKVRFKKTVVMCGGGDGGGGWWLWC